ncbi:MAG: 1,4-beta-xylanase [Fibrobacteres bacterium]|nr:1,4-beta-xylanase [Fibrobacterota bacterium]
MNRKPEFAKLISLFLFVFLGIDSTVQAAAAKFKVIAFWSVDGKGQQPDDKAHDSYSHESNVFFPKLGAQNNFTYDSTQDWTKLNDSAFLYQYQIVMFLDDFPAPNQQAAVRKYIERGGGFIAFHICAYNYPGDTHAPAWPWYFDTLFAGGQFVNNTWLPVSTKLKVEDTTDPVTKGFPKVYTSEVSEWYSWKNDLRKNPNIKILCSVDPSGFPVGTDPAQSWTSGYYPIVWTNTKYRMLYCNSGHNDMNYSTNTALSLTWSNAQHIKLILNTLEWLGSPPSTSTKFSGEMFMQRKPEMQIHFENPGLSIYRSGINDFGISIWDLRGNLISQGRSSNGNYSTGDLQIGKGFYLIQSKSSQGNESKAVSIH